MKRRSSKFSFKMVVLTSLALLVGIRLYYKPVNAEDEIKAPEPLYTIYKNHYGAITARVNDEIPGAIVEKVTLFSQKNGQICEKTCLRTGVLVRYPNAKGTVVICHGFMCNKYDVFLLRQIFKAGEYNVMTFDFRAHGDYAGCQYCTLGRDEAYDVIAAAHFLKEHPHLKGQPLLVYGFSMGAVAAIEAQSKEPLFTGMVLDCPFNCSETIIKHNIENIKLTVFGFEFGLPGRGLLQKYALHPYMQTLVKMALRAVSRIDPQNIKTQITAFKPSESVKNISVPCFFIHCKNDQTVPLDSIKEVYSGAGGQKKLWITNGRRHFDSYFYSPERYAQRVGSFFGTIIDGSIAYEMQSEVIEDGPDIFATDQKI